MKDKLHIDFETYSEVDLKKVGTYNYARHPSTGIWCMSYAFGNAPVRTWLRGQAFPPVVGEHVAKGGIVAAHNAPFEYHIWNYVLRKSRWLPPHLKWKQMDCTMARAYAMSLPGSLEDAGAALGLKVTKDSEGYALMMRMCKPLHWNGDTPVFVDEVPSFTFLGSTITFDAALPRLGSYCAMDVEVERAIDERVQPLSPKEKYIWRMDRRINDRGVLYDPEAVEGALEIRDLVVDKLNGEMKQLTNGAVATCGAVAALKDWLTDYGVPTDSLAKAILGELLNMDELPADVRRALELRAEYNRATSVAKVKQMKNLADENGRVRNMFQYHGAGTGRWAARNIQPHNFPRDLPKPAVVEGLMDCIRRRDYETIEMCYGQPLKTISQCLRGFMIAGKDKLLIGGDFSNVEGRKLAWLAGEDWKIDAFRAYDAGEGPDIYKRTYSETFGVAVGDIEDSQRQVGKVLELAFGYAGGAGAWATMADVYKVPEISPEEVQNFKHGWRDAHPRTVDYWYDLERAAIDAVLRPGSVHCAGAPGRQVKFRKMGSFLWCLLPSGRVLCYPYPQVVGNDWGHEMLTYKTVPSPEKWGGYQKAREEGREYIGQVVPDKGNNKRWCRMSTYGGKLAENVTQASCRDLLAETMVRLERAGYKSVLHVHDEIVVEGNFGSRDLKRVQEIMNEPPKWAHDFPLAADCWLAKRYQK